MHPENDQTKVMHDWAQVWEIVDRFRHLDRALLVMIFFKLEETIQPKTNENSMQRPEPQKVVS